MQNNKEEGRWITTETGTHVFIKKGQSVEQALNEAFDNDDSIPEIEGTLDNAKQVAKETLLRKFNKKDEFGGLEGIVKQMTEKYALSESEMQEVRNALNKYVEKNKVLLGSWLSPKDDEIVLPEYTIREERIGTGKITKKKYPIDWNEVLKENRIESKEELVEMIQKGLDNAKSDGNIECSSDIINHVKNSVPFVFSHSIEFDDLVEANSKIISKIWEEKRKPFVEKGKQYISKLPKQKYESDFAILLSINANKWNTTKGVEYHSNCYKCAQAWDMAYRGYNVVAGIAYEHETPGNNKMNGMGRGLMGYVEPVNGLDVYGNQTWFYGSAIRWRKNDKGSLGGTGPAQLDKITEIVSKGPEGARYQCQIAWQNGGGHVFNIIKKEGIIYFVDGQDGTTDNEVYFKKGEISPSMTTLFRVDDLDISENMQHAVEVSDE